MYAEQELSLGEQGINVFAGNLAYATDDASLRAFFAPVEDHIISVQVKMRGHRSAGYGFVMVTSQAAANRAVAELDKQELDGRPVIVEVAKPTETAKTVKATKPSKKPTPPVIEQTNNSSGAREGSRPAPETPPVSLEMLAKSVTNMESQLAMILKSLGDTQIRLDVVERAANRAQVGIESGQKGMTDVREQLTTVQEFADIARRQLSGFDRSIGAVESKTGALSECFSQHENHIAVLRGTVGGTREVLSGMGVSVDATRQQLVELSAQVGPKLEDMATSLSNSEDRLSEVEDTAGRTAESVAVVQQLVAAHNQILLNGNPASSNSQTGTARGEESRDSFRKQVTSLDQKVPALQAKTERLERAFGQTLENLTSVHNYLQTTQQQLTGLNGRVPAVEVKAEKLAESFTKNREELTAMQLWLATAGDRMNGLDSRMIDVEGRVEELANVLELVRGPTDDAPTVFPSGRGNDALASTTESSETAPFPWLPLPKPLEDM